MIHGAIYTLAHTYRKNENENEIIHFVTAFPSDKLQIKKYYTQDVDRIRAKSRIAGPKCGDGRLVAAAYGRRTRYDGAHSKEATTLR